MGAQVWFRGEAKGVAPASPEGTRHDLKDGMYFADTQQVAERYATERSATSADRRVYKVTIDLAKVRVLDLTTHPGWQKLMDTPMFNGDTPRKMLTRMPSAQEYEKFFDSFLKTNKIDLSQYDVVIGPEIRNGGKQLNILYKQGQPTSLHVEVRKSFQLLNPGFAVAPRQGMVQPPPIPPSRPTRMSGSVPAGKADTSGRSGGGSVGAGMAGGVFALASLIAKALLGAWATGNLAAKFSQDGKRMIRQAIEAHIWRYNVLISAHRLDILRAREAGIEVALYVVVDAELTPTNYGTAVTKAWVTYYTLLYGKNVPPLILHDFFKPIPATTYRRDGYRIVLEDQVTLNTTSISAAPP